MEPQTVVMDPFVAKSFDLVTDLIKQLITLSTGIIALTVTFHKDITPIRAGSAATFMRVAWGLHIASCLFGILGFMAVTGAFGRGQAQRGIYQQTITQWVGLQIAMFLFATVCVAISGGISLSKRSEARAAQDGPKSGGDAAASAAPHDTQK